MDVESFVGSIDLKLHLTEFYLRVGAKQENGNINIRHVIIGNRNLVFVEISVNHYDFVSKDSAALNRDKRFGANIRRLDDNFCFFTDLELGLFSRYIQSFVVFRLDTRGAATVYIQSTVGGNRIGSPVICYKTDFIFTRSVER